MLGICVFELVPDVLLFRAASRAMSSDHNKRTHRSGLSTSSSPTKMSAPPKPPVDGILTCNVQDVWRLLNTLQETVMRQSTKLKELALKNQGLEHRLQLQDLKLQQQDEKISMLQSQIDNHNATTQEKLITQDEKIKDMKSYAHVLEDGEINVNAYADEAKSTEHVKINVGTAEQSERVKRSMNVMLGGLPKAKKETIMMLNARMSKFFDEHFVCKM